VEWLDGAKAKMRFSRCFDVGLHLQNILITHFGSADHEKKIALFRSEKIAIRDSLQAFDSVVCPVLRSWFLPPKAPEKRAY